mgnify:CR=1 FL=1
MVKLVLLHKTDSIYQDMPDKKYDFPPRYLKAVTEATGDWVVYYEPGKPVPRGYFAVAKISDVITNPAVEGRFLALIEPATYLPFVSDVPFSIDGRRLESALRRPDGTPTTGGLVQSAVRRLPETDFARIVNLGLPHDLERIEATRYDPQPAELAEGAKPFERPLLERLTRRPYRDVVFRRKVRDAYGYRCAMSGLHLRNGGGRPEVQAAHIRPVKQHGNDSVRNGLALSGTLHWMFDRGLISVADDDATILISHNKVPAEVVGRLIAPGGRLLAPLDPRDAPHRDNLRWHREHVSPRAMPDDPPPGA